MKVVKTKYSPTCQQKPLGLIDVDGEVGMLIVVPFVLLHWLCHTHIPQLNLHINEEKCKVQAITASTWVYIFYYLLKNPIVFSELYTSSWVVC